MERDDKLFHILEELTAEMCDGYCKWPNLCKNEDELDEHCAKCPMNWLV